jgi:hypothetical protein
MHHPLGRRDPILVKEITWIADLTGVAEARRSTPSKASANQAIRVWSPTSTEFTGTLSERFLRQHQNPAGKDKFLVTSLAPYHCQIMRVYPGYPPVVRGDVAREPCFASSMRSVTQIVSMLAAIQHSISRSKVCKRLSQETVSVIIFQGPDTQCHWLQRRVVILSYHPIITIGEFLSCT